MSSPCKRNCLIEGKICNPATKRCVSRTGKIGKKLLSRPSSKKRSRSKSKKDCKKPCPAGKICNKETGRCVLKSGKIGSKIMMNRSRGRSVESAKITHIEPLPDPILSLPPSSCEYNYTKCASAKTIFDGFGLKYLIIPAGTRVYRQMSIKENEEALKNFVFFKHAKMIPTWYSNYKTAMLYIKLRQAIYSSPKDNDIMGYIASYRFKTDAKLLILTDNINLTILISNMQHSQPIFTKGLQVITGHYITCKGQEMLLRSLEKDIKFSTGLNRVLENDDTSVIKRLSEKTIDKIIVSDMCRLLPINGYVGAQSFTCINKAGAFHEEIALCYAPNFLLFEKLTPIYRKDI